MSVKNKPGCSLQTRSAEERMTLWLERRHRIGAGSKKQNENKSQLHFRKDCKAQVKKLPLFCKTVAPASAAVSLRICQPVAWPIPS
ncbi:hypothetical protein [Comamonas thiooxydans]|uniref:hypothetical protein n=1 Tax=Comamonas thiooxydans TaxID=363952 RepID=UPI000F503025|nr:hypothetical protein [Comamonas thiooxydans]